MIAKRTGQRAQKAYSALPKGQPRLSLTQDVLSVGWRQPNQAKLTATLISSPIITRFGRGNTNTKVKERQTGTELPGRGKKKSRKKKLSYCLSPCQPGHQTRQATLPFASRRPYSSRKTRQKTLLTVSVSRRRYEGAKDPCSASRSHNAHVCGVVE